ncbi:hypothetical protein [Legionella feeleii]|nr:hypothetical protein [Legionella feeleii]
MKTTLCYVLSGFICSQAMALNSSSSEQITSSKTVIDWAASS